MEWSTHQVVESTGITSRTLRHYDQIGLLMPTRTGIGGLRYYDQLALVRLQRILLLRELGLPLDEIADILDDQISDIDALREHRQRLMVEHDGIDAQIPSGAAPDSEAAQDMAARHVEWLGSAMTREQLTKDMVKGITQMYVDDERFAVHYNRVSPAGPQFVRDAIHLWADGNLRD